MFFFISQQPPATKRKRYEQQQQQQQSIAQDYLLSGVENTTELIDLDSTQSYTINEYGSHSSSPVVDNTINPPQISQQSQLRHPTTQHIITRDGLMYEQLDYDYSTASVQSDQTPIKIESNEFILTESAPATSTPKTTTPARAVPQQHFKKKMQLQARSAAAAVKPLSNKPIKAEVIDDVVVETNPQILAIIANPDDLEDLSHLDQPIVPEPQTHLLNAKQSDYIGSYCSFLKSRTHK